MIRRYDYCSLLLVCAVLIIPSASHTATRTQQRSSTWTHSTTVVVSSSRSTSMTESVRPSQSGSFSETTSPSARRTTTVTATGSTSSALTQTVASVSPTATTTFTAQRTTTRTNTSTETASLGNLGADPKAVRVLSNFELTLTGAADVWSSAVATNREAVLKGCRADVAAALGLPLDRVTSLGVESNPLRYRFQVSANVTQHLTLDVVRSLVLAAPMGQANGVYQANGGVVPVSVASIVVVTPSPPVAWTCDLTCVILIVVGGSVVMLVVFAALMWQCYRNVPTLPKASRAEHRPNTIVRIAPPTSRVERYSAASRRWSSPPQVRQPPHTPRSWPRTMSHTLREPHSRLIAFADNSVIDVVSLRSDHDVRSE